MPTDRQRRAAAKNSKRGYRFQYRVACAMTKVWGMKVVSSPRSGGSHWKGDIIPKDPATDWNSWPFVVECKSRESWDLRQLLLQPKGGVLAEWWWKVSREADAASKLPLLIVSCRSRPGDFAITPRVMWEGPYDDLDRLILYENQAMGCSFFVHEFGRFLRFNTLEEWTLLWVHGRTGEPPSET